MDEAYRSGRDADDRVRICPLSDLERERAEPLDAPDIAQIDAIFFAASRTQVFADESERAAFRERWLGRYLDRYRQHFFLALAQQGRIVGYLAGCLDDPAPGPPFADIGYFAALADLTQIHPAHLHINLDAAWRGRGIGARLIEAFCAHAGAAGAMGVHVITGGDARNERFYTRCGFRPLRAFDWKAARLVMLGRRLDA